jgi:carbon starvation protein
MNPRAYILFLLFVWSALIYVIIAFLDVTAGTFVAAASATDAAAPGPAVATSSMLYLGLAVAMGLVLRFTSIGPGRAKIIFLPLVAVAIALGPLIPLNLASILPASIDPQRAWGYLLLLYCLAAALVPVCLLLQPRGELGGWFLYIVMAVMVVGVTAGAFFPAEGTAWFGAIQYPFFKGWSVDSTANPGITGSLFPLLFITVACGACSGFHSIVASGTTSKQLRTETDAKPVAYGSMLLEGFLACLSLTTVMILLPDTVATKPDAIYANGVTDLAGRLLAPLGLNTPGIRQLVLQFALLCFATFVFDTLDACTRLARYVLMELLGWTRRSQAFLATIICLIPPAIVLALPPVLVDERPRPLWAVFWNIFGSSNQLLAALTLLGVTVWMARKRMPAWIALAPTLFMTAMTLWSLGQMLAKSINLHRMPNDTGVPIIETVKLGIVSSLIILCLWLIGEAILTWHQIRRDPDLPLQPAPKLAAS